MVKKTPGNLNKLSTFPSQLSKEHIWHHISHHLS